jgi:hypothetical protein
MAVLQSGELLGQPTLVMVINEKNRRYGLGFGIGELLGGELFTYQIPYRL